jgi:hypothetical protein
MRELLRERNVTVAGNQVTLQRERIDTAKTESTENVLFGSSQFRRHQHKFFEKNGGDDETRTRDLCRDRAAF